MKLIEVSFKDVWEFDDNVSEEYVFDTILEYLADCVRCEDVTAFGFKEVKDNQ
jgi:hypothetical protein